MLLIDSVCDFGVEAIARAEKGDFCVGVEEVEDPACCYLSALRSMSTLFSKTVRMLFDNALDIPRRLR